jgi:choline dehydrogenase-like flavoprotein
MPDIIVIGAGSADALAALSITRDDGGKKILFD